MMVNSIPIRFVVAAVAIITFLSLVTSVGHSQAFPFVSPVTAIVFDESGAMIPDSELVFRSDPREIVSHTGADGSVTVSLQNGRYSVDITKPGFVKTEVRGLQVPISEALRVVMKVAPTPINGPTIVGPTTSTSDLPNAIAPETSRVPTVHPVKKSRSRQCLYLWKCSAS
jgi:carboxypeptidase family protein